MCDVSFPLTDGKTEASTVSLLKLTGLAKANPNDSGLGPFVILLFTRYIYIKIRVYLVQKNICQASYCHYR